MQTPLKRRIVVLGGYGEFSHRVAAGVAALPEVECVLGLPSAVRATWFASRIGVPFMVLDPNDPSSLFRLLEGAFAVVNVHGPFATREHLTVAARCAALGVHYVDPADSREYLTEFMRLAREAREHNSLLVTGAGAAPAVTTALASWLAGEFDRVNEIHVFLTPGMDDHRELATTRAVLEQVANPMRVKEHGRWREQHWWQRPQTVRFPRPIGRRRGYLCDLPDSESLARRFGARTVTARAGFAPGFLNFTLAVLAFLRRRGWVRRFSPLTAWFVRTVASLSQAHVNAAGIRVAMRGSRRSTEEEHVVALIARDGAGPAISAAPILALVRQWLAQGVKQTGAMTCVDLLSFDDLKPELAGHHIVLVRE